VLAADGSATANLSSLNGGPIAGTRNRIINGDMRIDQRNAGASGTVATGGAYTVDRWFVQPNGASVTTQRVTGSGSYQNALRITGAASVTECFVQQKIESLNSYDLAGQTITVTIRASSSTLTSLTCYVERATAGADNWSTFATDKTQPITINSTPANYTFQATLSGSATNGIRFIFATGAFTSGTLDITGVQLEPGSVATPFERRSYGAELALCQRYCQQIGGVSGVPWALATISGGSSSKAAVIFGVLMRSSPSLFVVSTGFDACDNSLGPVTATVTLDTASPYVAYLTYSHATLTNNAARRLLTTNATSFLQFSAEL
jgi:hypothetical protein